MNIGIYGAGNFGFALLAHLDKNKKGDTALHVFDADAAVVASLRERRRHPRLFRAKRIRKDVVVHDSAASLIKECGTIILAINSDAMRSVLRTIRRNADGPVTLINTAKALDHRTGGLLSELAAHELGDALGQYAVLAGGTIARDLARHEPLGVDMACRDSREAARLAALFASEELCVYPTTDVVGAECAGAFKNVIAILAGIAKGLNFSFGAETHIISRAAGEAEQLITANYGGTLATFRMSSQCWGNDLWMSCLGSTRNRKFGELVGKRQSFSEARKIIRREKITVEGLNTLAMLGSVPDLSRYPILHATHELSRRKVSFARFRAKLFTQQGAL